MTVNKSKSNTAIIFTFYRPNLPEISYFSPNQVRKISDSQKVATRARNLTSWVLLWTQDNI